MTKGRAYDELIFIEGPLEEVLDEELAQLKKDIKAGIVLERRHRSRYMVSRFKYELSLVRAEIERRSMMLEDNYKTHLGPLHRALVGRALQLAASAEPLWGQEDRERSEAALSAVVALLEGPGDRATVVAAEKRVRASAKKWQRRMGKVDWSANFSAVLLVAAVARLAATEYPAGQVQTFEACLRLWELING